MPLDPTTLIVVNVANLLVMTMALSFIMGQHLSPAASDARRSLLLNAGTWICLLLSTLWYRNSPDWILSTLAMSLLSASHWKIYRALEHWLGARPLRHGLLALVWITPVIYALSFQSYPIRVGSANLLYAAQMLILMRACLYPSSREFGRRSWRYPLAGCLGVMACFTAARGILGGWFTELYPFFRAPTPVNIMALVAANMSLVLGSIAILAAWREEIERQLHKLATTDPLTGLLNRHGWQTQAERHLHQSRRHGQPLSLLMLDVDHFKRINDTQGHEAGDAALKFLALLLQRCQRAGDVSARIGGEEFCLLLPHTDTQAAQQVDSRLRTELTSTVLTALPFALEFSSGHALFRPSDTLETLMARADAALYRAKHAGRNQLVVAHPPAHDA